MEDKVITKILLENLGACRKGTKYARENLIGMSYPNAIRQCIKDGKSEWAAWGIVRVMAHESQVKYAIYAAKQVIAVYEAANPGDTRPRDAIKAAERLVKNPTNVNSASAAAAAANASAAAVAGAS